MPSWTMDDGRLHHERPGPRSLRDRAQALHHRRRPLACLLAQAGSARELAGVVGLEMWLIEVALVHEAGVVGEEEIER